MSKPSRIKLLKIILRDATATLEIMPEDTQIEGNALDSGDPGEDAKHYQWIRDQLESGNDAAWCTACVEVSWQGYTERDYLGCCSYNSVEEMRTDLLADMRQEACTRLANRLHKEYETIASALAEVL